MLTTWFEMLVFVVLAVLMRPAVVKINGADMDVSASETLFRIALNIVSPGRAGPVSRLTAARGPRFDTRTDDVCSFTMAVCTFS